MNDPWSWTTAWGLTVGARGGMGGEGQRGGGDWYNYNRITTKKMINKKIRLKAGKKRVNQDTIYQRAPEISKYKAAFVIKLSKNILKPFSMEDGS